MINLTLRELQREVRDRRNTKGMQTNGPQYVRIELNKAEALCEWIEEILTAPDTEIA